VSSEHLYNNEKELLSSLSNGDDEALKFIYQKYWQRLFVSAYNVLRDKEACEDIIQEIFIQLWHKRDALVITTSLPSYLFTATRFQVFHAIKKIHRRPELFQNIEQRFSTDAPDVPLYLRDIQQRVNSVIENLPEKCRHIYKLSREQNLSYKEISAQLQIAPKTVENQLAIALKKIRKALADLLFFIF